MTPTTRMSTVRLLTAAMTVATGLTCGSSATARDRPPVPDLTRGGKLEGKHDWNLGPTGLRGAMWAWSMVTTDARQIVVTKVDRGSPADGIVHEGDVILGAGGGPFTSDARVALGNAITAAETDAAGGSLDLLIWRRGEGLTVTIPLRVMGSYGALAPYGSCEKSARIIEAGVSRLAGNISPSIPGQVNALALLATGDERLLPSVRELAHKVGPKDLDLRNDRNMPAWHWGYHNLFLTEYYLATGDDDVLPAIEVFSNAIARGQSAVGTWGHGMAWPEENNGQPHGPLGGYGALNQAGLVCQLSLVLAVRCGVADEEVVRAVAKGNRFFEFYIHKGSIPYGDHNPGPNHGDNGKNAIAAILFDLQNRGDGAAFFSRMTVASYGESEMGHTGNYFSYLWGPLGAGRAGPAAAAAFLEEMRWYYDLARRWDGGFPYQGADESDKYGNWDCTGAYLLTYLLPRERLHITGRGRHGDVELTGAALADTIEAGRGFVVPERGITPYLAKSKEALLRDLASWSPPVRQRASEALAKKADDTTVQAVVALLSANEATARYGACAALGALKAESAVPALAAALNSDDVWLRIQAAYALSAIGDPARRYAETLLDVALSHHDADPREYTQRYLCYALFYPGGAMGKAGLFARSIDGVDREKLYAAVQRLLKNDDGRARGTIPSVYKQLSYEEITPLLPAIYESIWEQAPSGEMFASGVRLKGLELFAHHRIAEGMPLCIHVMDIHKWGKHKRIPAALDILETYGAAAKAVLPELRDLQKRLRAHREKGMDAHADRVATLIAKLESADEDPRPLRRLDFPTHGRNLGARTSPRPDDQPGVAGPDGDGGE